ncbi:MAG TPA: cyclase family protein [Rubrobacteraceae bacterium]|nr:cyclase family protein [Rubrobacteraceae bacterium]
MTLSRDAVASLVGALGSGAVKIVDLTQPLSERTPVIQLPEQFAQTPGLKVHEVSRYDERGPAWAWNWLEIGEHVGTHFDAPVHWISGRDGLDVSQVPPRHLVAPAVVIDRSEESAADPDYLLTIEDIGKFEAEHGLLPEGGWLLLRTVWDARAQDAEAFLNARDGRPRSPGVDAECSRWIAEESPLVGVGVETVGIDAGAAGGFEPPFPLHYYLLGAGKYGVTQLANLGKLPPTGALLVIAPLKLVGGTGSPVRALALVPRT